MNDSPVGLVFAVACFAGVMWFVTSYIAKEIDPKPEIIKHSFDIDPPRAVQDAEAGSGPATGEAPASAPRGDAPDAGPAATAEPPAIASAAEPAASRVPPDAFLRVRDGGVSVVTEPASADPLAPLGAVRALRGLADPADARSRLLAGSKPGPAVLIGPGGSAAATPAGSAFIPRVDGSVVVSSTGGPASVYAAGQVLAAVWLERPPLGVGAAAPRKFLAEIDRIDVVPPPDRVYKLAKYDPRIGTFVTGALVGTDPANASDEATAAAAELTTAFDAAFAPDDPRRAGTVYGRLVSVDADGRVTVLVDAAKPGGITPATWRVTFAPGFVAKITFDAATYRFEPHAGYRLVVDEPGADVG